MGGMDVTVGGTLVAVGGTMVVAVGGMVVAVGGTTFVAVGGTLVAVGGTTVGGTLSEQRTPFTAKLVGMVAELLPFVPWKPKAAVPPLAPILPFQWLATLEADMAEPVDANVAFQPLPNCSPDPNVQVRFHPLMAALVLLVMVTLA